MMQVTVKTLGGKNIPVRVNPSDSVEQITQQITQQEGIPGEMQRLIFMGKQLAVGASLSEQQVQDQSTIHMVLRLR